MGAAGQVNEGAAVKVSTPTSIFCYGQVALIIEGKRVRSEVLVRNIMHFGRAGKTRAPPAEID